MRIGNQLRRIVPATALAAAVLTAGSMGASGAAAATGSASTPTREMGSLAEVAGLIGATSVWDGGNTGAGIDVAVIDTGVTRVEGLDGTNVVNGPDLSFDSQSTATRYVDSYGHGTHISSIVAGRDGAAGRQAAGDFSGIAPGARVVNVKVGASDGTVDVTQTIAAINWVTQHAKDPGMNIRVINLSYGTAGTQWYGSDPLAYAAETAWRKGILVVVAGGNDGTSRPHLADPAINPNLLAVGASDPKGTPSTTDDVIPAFSQRGNEQRHVDVVAPGRSILGLRAPGSAVDTAHPTSRAGERYTRGSGTSQASAVVAGAAALLLKARPELSPDQVKWLLMKTAEPLAGATVLTAGAGLIDVQAAIDYKGSIPASATLTAGRQWGTGTGSVEASRGTAHVRLNNQDLAGEKDIFGRTWNASAWARATANATSWNGGTYSGNAWTGTAFGSDGNWTGRSWVGNSWTGRSWVGQEWAGRSWVDHAWKSGGWYSGSWASGSWS